MKPIRRCAVYTRKSSEEGLEQDFNSLQAQREACEAFIASQRGEGWKLVSTLYDDGGLSGGNMQRPALLRLMEDIRLGLIDAVVVYKVDRLTRSIGDFAKMVEVFDNQNVSFVAVTQQFNTTTSMGRLTLNVLLSFAQFEREVTGERIRDKIAASKRKGMWMGGHVPFGYEKKDRTLVPIPHEADQVRHIFEEYLKADSPMQLLAELKAKGIVMHRHNGKPGAALQRGGLYWMLSNPIYIGQIRHKKECFEGQHEAIIDETLWQQVQQRLKDRSVRKDIPNSKVAKSPLADKIFDEAGETLQTSHATKAGRRYRYYISRGITASDESDAKGWRLPALEIEKRVQQVSAEILEDRSTIVTAALGAGLSERDLPEILRTAAEIETSGFELVTRVNLSATELGISIAIPLTPPLLITKVVPLDMKRRGVEMRLVIPGKAPPEKPDQPLMKNIGKAMRWWDMLLTGQAASASEIAQREGVSDRYVQKMLPLALLAPTMIEEIASGTQAAEMLATDVMACPALPMRWSDQQTMFWLA